MAKEFTMSNSVPTPTSLQPTDPVRYQASYETGEADEAQTTANLIETIEKIQRKVHADGGHAARGVHAKSHGLLRGELHILDRLPPVLTQGLFASPATYPVVLRFSTMPGDILDDAVSTPRGLAVKVVGVKGERLDGSQGDVTQDFVLVNGPAFAKPTAKSFAATLKLLAATTDRAEGLKKVVSSVTRGAEKLLESVGGQSATLAALGGQPETHLLGETYYSQVPILFGDYMAKIAVAPVSSELLKLVKLPLDFRGDRDALRSAVLNFFAVHDAQWELRVQLCTNLQEMPIEDAAKVWPEDQSPYLAVARINVPAQLAWSEARSLAVDDGMAFSPWHGLAAHRPLGSVNRVRRAVYAATARFRAQSNGRVIEEPRTLDGLPA
jgi:hypothetical protein